MIAGVVSGGRELVVFVEVRGPGGESDFVRAVIDTGFTANLVLPDELIRRLRLQPLMKAKLRLGDGTIAEMQEYAADVIWHGEVKRISVMASSDDVLLGMRLLRGSRLIADIVEGGDVTIEPIVTPRTP